MSVPEVILPDLKLQPEDMLLDPENIRLSDDIPNPDLVIDNIIDNLKSAGSDTSWLFAVREFGHEDKVKWIQSLPEPVLENGCEGYLFFITEQHHLMVKVAEDAAGEPLYKKKMVELQVQKCVPQQ